MGQTLVTSPSSPSYGFQSWTSSDLNVAIDEVNDMYEFVCLFVLEKLEKEERKGKRRLCPGSMPA
eukprot:m.115964 g.115964  ORF g.115964 m.115964 type:complete len:65 (-) comp15383_c0_seq2:1116-1310(-)